jgi:hypothetical protein
LRGRATSCFALQKEDSEPDTGHDCGCGPVVGSNYCFIVEAEPWLCTNYVSLSYFALLRKTPWPALDLTYSLIYLAV